MRRVGAMRWNYDRAELIAEGVVHGIGVFGGLVAATVLIVLTAIYATGFERRGGVGLCRGAADHAGGLSATYKSVAGIAGQMGAAAPSIIRRSNVLIAATYTPFIMQMKDSIFAIALLIGVVVRGDDRES